MKTPVIPRSAMKAPVFSLLFLAHCALAPRLCAQAESPEFPPILPQWRLDTLAASDGTYYRCLVFTARPGVLYTVECSPDLINWTEDATIYGMGHEFATAMARTAAPSAAPPPGGGPPPAPGVARRLVSLRLSPSSGEEGGTVVSWLSLDGSRTARVALIPETLVSSWALMPLYVNGFGAHEFFIGYSGRPTAPPDPAPEPGAEDAAMLAALRENLPAINAQVAASVARSINSPAPAPPDPNSRRFWRIRVDRGLDSDGDGVPDWLEFFLAAGPDGDSMADAFVKDTDHDGVRDGYQIDSDRDGQPDLLDPDPNDGDVGTSDPAARFAVFPIAARTAPEGGALVPLMINSYGTVLYQDAWWRHGDVTPLAADNPGHVSGCTALSINDSGHILGMGMAQRPPAGGGSGGQGGSSGSTAIALPLIHCWWSAPDAVPVPVEAGGRFALPAPRVMESPASLATADPFPFDSLLSGMDRFMADRVHDTQPSAKVRALWSTIPDGFSRFEAPGNAYSANGFDPVFATEGLLGLSIYGPANGGSRLMSPSQTYDLAMDMRRLRVTATPNEMFEVACGPGTDTHVYRAGRWRVSQALANATDIGINSLRLAHVPAEGDTPAADVVAQDARVLPWVRWAPGLTGAAATPANANRADSGWVLGRLSGGAAQACMPVSFGDDEASGTDPESLRGFPWEPILGAQEKCWVMVPQGGPANAFRLHSLATGGTVLRVTAPGLEWGGGGETAEFGSPVVSTSLAADAEANIESGANVDLQINLGTQASAKVDSASTPLAGYVMKARVVRVRPIRVINTTGGAQNGPDLEITRANLEPHLNAIYGPQINVTFAVEDPVDLPIAWDTAQADGILDLDDEVAGMLTATANAADDIRVFLIGTDHPFTAVEQGKRNNEIAGFANRNDPEDTQDTRPNACWLVADAVEGRTKEHLLGTISHEIGHILVGYGHPDDPTSRSPAPLPGTDRRKRLMSSGDEVDGAIRTGKLLVKKEWEMAEIWLRENIDSKTN